MSQFAKRDIQLVDSSGQSVRLTLWGKQAETFEAEKNPVIAFKGVKVGDFGGRSLSMFSNATMVVNPDIQECHELRGWYVFMSNTNRSLTFRYDAGGKDQNFQAYTNQSTTRSDNSVTKPSELKTIGQAKTEQLGYGEKTDYFTTQGTIAFLKQESFDYPACANPEGCNKKVNDNGNGWLCEKCDRTWPAPIYRYASSSPELRDTKLMYRYILQVNLMDHAGQMWITAFNEVAEQMMGISANDLHALKDEGNEVEFNKYFQTCVGKTFTFQMMAKQDTYQVSHSLIMFSRKLTR